MKTHVIEINGQKYQLRFGYGALAALGQRWKLKGPAAVADKISKAFDGAEDLKEDMPFDLIQVMAEMTLSAIAAADPKAAKGLKVADIGDLIFKSPDEFSVIFTAYAESITVNTPAPEGK